MRAIINRLTMGQKILILCLCTIVSVYAGVMFCVRIGSERFYERKLSLITQQMLEQAGNAISAELRNVINLIHYGAISGEMQSLLEMDMNSPSEYAVAMSGLEPILTQIAIKNKYIDSVQVVVDGHSFFGLNHPMHYDESLDFAEKLQANVIYWSDTVYYNESSRSKVLPVVMYLPVSQRTQDKYPFIIVNLNISQLEKMLAGVSDDTQGSVSVYNGDRKILQSGEVSGKHQVENYAVISVNDWRIQCVQSREVLFKDLNTVYCWVFGITFVIALGCMLLAWLLVGSLTRPLRLLARLTHQLEKHDFSVRFSGESQDEIGQLGRSFNQMCTEIEYYVQQLKQEKQEVKRNAELKRKAELRALQAHINPHFLYNTLDSMYWYSITGNKDDLSHLIICLSDMLHIALSKGKELISVREELRHVENYLQIEKIILKDKFDYSIEAAEEVLEYPIVKIVLQPLVENSLTHGLKNFESGGMIRVQLSRNEEHLQICVEDNGCGFGMDQPSGFAGQQRHSGYALKNITQRIQLHYGQDICPQIQSEPGRYTQITIRIPVERLERAAQTAAKEDGKDGAAIGG